MNKYKKQLFSKKATTWLIVVNLLLLQWFSYGFNFRIDLSGSGRFRITSATKKILKELPSKVTIEAYFSEDVPELFIQPVKQLRDFLSEYANASKGKVKLRFLNPDEDPEIQQKARALGIQPMPIGAADNKKQEFSNVYFSLAINYEDQKQIIPDILRSQQVLEYNLTSRIHKMAYPLDSRVGFLVGNSPFVTQRQQNPFYGHSILNQSLEAFYGNFVQVSAANNNIPDNVNVLFIPSPSRLSEIEKYRIDQFLMAGGKLILAISGVNINFQNGRGVPVDPTIIEFFANYGIEFGKNIVYEPKHYIPLRQQVGFQVLEREYPLWLNIPNELLDEESVITGELATLFLPWSSSIKLNESKIEQIEYKVLAKTSNQAWLKNQLISIDPQQAKAMMEAPEKPNQGEVNVAYHVKGIFNSYYTDAPPPKELGENTLLKSSPEAEIIAIASPYAFTDRAIQQTKGLNVHFFLAALDVLNGKDELVTARNRKISNPSIGPIDYWLKSLFTLLNFLLPILLLGVYGFIKYIARKKLSQLSYATPGETAKIMEEKTSEKRKKIESKGKKAKE